METRWLFTAFDWQRFQELLPRVQAVGHGTPTALDDIEGSEEVLEEFDEEAAPEEVRNALLVELCTVGEGALFESGFPELLTWLRRQRHGEDAADVLAEMISASPGIQDWFAAESGIVGLLTVEETSDLARQIGQFRRYYKQPARPRGLAALTRYFITSEPAAEHLEVLCDVIAEAAAEMLGLAAMRVS